MAKSNTEKMEELQTRRRQLENRLKALRQQQKEADRKAANKRLFARGKEGGTPVK